MSKNCIAKILLQGQQVEVDLGEFENKDIDNAYKLDSIYKTIIDGSTEIRDALESTKPINKPNKFDIREMDDSTSFPLSNTTVGEIANMYGGKLATLYSKIPGGVPEENLLLLNSKFSFDGFSSAGLYEKKIGRTTRKLTILNGSVDSITNYLTYHYILLAQFKNKDLRAIYANLKGVDEYKGSNFEEFLKYYFFDTKARVAIDKALRKNGTNAFDDVVVKLINNDTQYPSMEGSEEISTLINNIKKTGYISRTELNNFEEKYKLKTDLEAIRFLNYRGANLITIYKDDNVLVFDKDKSLEKLNIQSGSVYIKDIINEWVDYKEGYKIYKVPRDGKSLYFITNVEINNGESLNGKILFDTADEAIADFEKRYRSRLLKDCKLKVKPGDKITCRLYKNFISRVYKNWVFDKDWENKTYSDMYKNYKIRYRDLFAQHPDWLDAIAIPNNLLILLSIKSKLSKKYMDSKPDTLVPNVRSSEMIQEDYRETEKAFNELMQLSITPYTVNDKGEFVESTPSNNTNFEKNTIFDNTRNQVNDLFTLIKSLQDRLGVKINITNNYSAKILIGIDTAKAFVYNGEIYVNIDRATNADVIHEYGHLILGTIKQCNYSLYKSLISSAEKSDYFSEMLMMMRLNPNYASRAYQDLVEEVYCDIFGEYISKNPGDFEKIIKIIFGLRSNIDKDDLGEIANMNFNDLINRYGSTIFESNGFDFSESFKSRKDANIIEKAIKSGLVIENC